MSYGVNAPQGLQPRTDLTGAAWNNQTNRYNIISAYGTNLFTGDPVTFDGNGGVAIGVAGAAILGVFFGCEYLLNGTFVYSPFWPAGTTPDNGTNATAFIIDDPNVVFDIQVGTAVAAPTPAVILSNIGANANFHSGAGSTRSGQSGFYLDFAAINNTATDNLKILGFTPVPTNPTPTVADGSAGSFNNALVIINNHIYKGGTGTAGI